MSDCTECLRIPIPGIKGRDGKPLIHIDYCDRHRALAAEAEVRRLTEQMEGR